MVFDKAYLDFAHLFDLLQRGVFRVTRARENLACEVIKALPVAGRILRDEIIALRTAGALASYPEVMRPITALVEIDGREVEMVFLTNNMEWSPASVADLYRPFDSCSGHPLPLVAGVLSAAEGIEAFFKQIKQTLQLADFLGHSANGSPTDRPPLVPGAAASAVRWQVWTALLVYVLPFGPFGCAQGTRRLRALSLSKRLRFLAYAHDWHHSFTRLFTLLRSALWRRWDLASLLQCYGRASGAFRFIATPQQPCFNGF